MDRKKITLILVISILAFNLVRSILETRSNLSRLSRLQGEVESLRKDVALLEKEESYKESAEFLEREARDKLGLIKEGERVVILPDNSAVLGVSEISKPTAKIDRTPNWKKWQKFLFN